MAMRWTQEEQDREELAQLNRRLVDIENPGRQVTPTASGREYRARLRRDIEILQKRLSIGKTR